MCVCVCVLLSPVCCFGVGETLLFRLLFCVFVCPVNFKGVCVAILYIITCFTLFKKTKDVPGSVSVDLGNVTGAKE